MAESEAFNVARWAIYPAVLLLVTIVYYLRRWYRLRHFKGPWLASISELWLAKTALSGSFHTILMDTNKKYGALQRTYGRFEAIANKTQ